MEYKEEILLEDDEVVGDDVDEEEESEDEDETDEDEEGL